MMNAHAPPFTLSDQASVGSRRLLPKAHGSSKTATSVRRRPAYNATPFRQPVEVFQRIVVFRPVGRKFSTTWFRIGGRDFKGELYLFFIGVFS